MFGHILEIGFSINSMGKLLISDYKVQCLKNEKLNYSTCKDEIVFPH